MSRLRFLWQNITANPACPCGQSCRTACPCGRPHLFHYCMKKSDKTDKDRKHLDRVGSEQNSNCHIFIFVNISKKMVGLRGLPQQTLCQILLNAIIPIPGVNFIQLGARGKSQRQLYPLRSIHLRSTPLKSFSKVGRMMQIRCKTVYEIDAYSAVQKQEQN